MGKPEPGVYEAALSALGRALDTRPASPQFDTVIKEGSPLANELQELYASLKMTVDAVIADQGNDRKAVGELYDNLAHLGGPAEAIRTLMHDVIRMEAAVAKLEKNQPIGQDIPYEMRAVVRDATTELRTQYQILTSQVLQLEERLTQSEQRNRGWQRIIDATLGRRPRG